MAFDDLYRWHVSITSTGSAGLGIPGDYREEKGTTGGVYRLVSAGEQVGPRTPLVWSDAASFIVKKPDANGVPIVGLAEYTISASGWGWMKVAGLAQVVNFTPSVDTGEPVVAMNGGAVSKHVATAAQTMTATYSQTVESEFVVTGTANETITSNVSATYDLAGTRNVTASSDAGPWTQSITSTVTCSDTTSKAVTASATAYPIVGVAVETLGVASAGSIHLDCMW